MTPGPTATGLVPDTPVARFLARAFLRPRAAARAAMHALLSPRVEGGAFLSNFCNSWTDGAVGSRVFCLACALGLRQRYMRLAFLWGLAFLHDTYGVHCSDPHVDAHDVELCETFMRWNRSAVSAYMNK